MVQWKDEVDAQAQNHIERAEWLDIDTEKMAKDRAAMVDISSGGAYPLKFGRETLMVNASIMTLTYKPWQGPWAVDLDLEKADEDVVMGDDA